MCYIEQGSVNKFSSGNETGSRKSFLDLFRNLVLQLQILYSQETCHCQPRDAALTLNNSVKNIFS